MTVTLQVGGGIQGFGTISADVNVDFGDSPLEMLLADNGVLAIGGDFHFVALGTADGDGILEVTHDWNTVVTNGTVPVTLNGGELRGGDITHDLIAGIRGHGLISARVINNSTISAETAGRSCWKRTTTITIGTEMARASWERVRPISSWR